MQEWTHPRRRLWPRSQVVLAVAAGGLLGAPARYGIGLGVHNSAGGFPVATFVINVSGSFALGALVTLIVERWSPTQYVRPFAATGFLGAYTTWSTFMVDADLLVKNGHPAMAAGYVVASLVAGLAAVYLGILAVRRWRR